MEQKHSAVYLRLSREDGDKAESDSIANQKALLSRFVSDGSGLSPPEYYIDDGYTGTNFDRPAFKRMTQDIESGKIDCVVVKDLSRFGRDYIETGRYLERWLPEHGVRFIAVNDSIDSGKAAYDMRLPLKNVFNTQYAKDISQKVKASIRAKQQHGDFVGAFPSYGYIKSPDDRGRLVIDPPAAAVVQKIFDLFEAGTGKLGIARQLNCDGIPCPSEYKRLCGEKYRNGQKIESTRYWTYSTVDRILKSQMYIGNMEQGKNYRLAMHGRAKRLDKADWVVVSGTHPPIISQQQWERVQGLLEKSSRSIDFDRNISPFAGYLKCGDCGRAMSKTRSRSGTYYCCGSYKRYGASICSRHGISGETLESIVLGDINRIFACVSDLCQLVETARQDAESKGTSSPDLGRLQSGLNRLYRLKMGAYEDYRDGLLSRSEYTKYKADYELQEVEARRQLEALEPPAKPAQKPWVKALLEEGALTELDRVTVAEVLEGIKVFEGGRVEISYRFSPDFLENAKNTP